MAQIVSVTVLTPNSSGVSDGDKGDVIVSGSGAVWTFDSAVVTTQARTLLAATTQSAQRTAVGLGSVENTALSTWAGSANITTVGTIGTGTWNATAIAKSKLSGLDKFEIAEASVASAATCDIGGATSDNVLITGTTGITSFGTGTAGIRRYVRFSGALTITHNATSLILPTSANVTTVAGDSLIAECVGSGNWKVLSYQRQDGTPLAGGGGGAAIDGSNITTPATWLSKLSAIDQYDVLARVNELKGGVLFDGVTTSQRATAFLGDFSIGKDDFSASIILRIPTALVNNGPILALSSSSTTTAAQSFQVYIDQATGKLYVVLYGGTTGATDSYRWISTASFLSTYGGKLLVLSVVRSSGSGLVYVNGIDITSSGAWGSGGGGAAPASFAASVAGNYAHIGGLASIASYAERIVSVALFNRALSAADVLTLANNGILQDARWVTIHGFNSILNIEKDSTFTAGAASNWVATGGGTSISTAGAVVLGAAAGSVSLSGISGYITQLTPGVLYKLTLDVSGGTFGANSVTAYWGNAVGATDVTLGTFNANGSYSFEFTPTFGLGVLSLVAITGASNFTINNVRIARVMVTNGSFETSGGGTGTWTGTSAASWEAQPSGTTAISRDTTITHSGGASVKILTDGSNSQGFIRQNPGFVIGKKYRLKFWARGGATAGTEKVSYRLGDFASITEVALTTSWQQITSADTVYSGTFLISRGSTGSAGQTIYIDDVEIVEAGAIAEFNPQGIDDFTPRWTNNNPLGGDAYLTGLNQRSDGSYANIITTFGCSNRERDALSIIGHQSGVMSLGGVVLAGNSNQRITINPGPDVSTNAFWVRCHFMAPYANPSATNGGLFVLSSSSTAALVGSMFRCYIGTSGELVINQYGSTSSDKRTLTLNNFVQMFGGRTVDMLINRSGGAITVWLNGNRVMLVESVAGTPPNFGASLTTTYEHIGAAETTITYKGEIYRYQVGRGTITDVMARNVYTGGVGTGVGESSGTAISRGGIMASTDGVVLDTNLAIGYGNTFPDKSFNGYNANSNLQDEKHKIPDRLAMLNYGNADKRTTICSPNGAAGVSAFGDSFTVQGTPSSSAADANQPQCTNVVTAATAASFAGYYSSAIHYTGRNPRAFFDLRLVDVVNARVIVGLHSSTSTAFNAASWGAFSVAAFRFSTAESDTTWKCITANASTPTVNDSGVTVDTTRIQMEIEIFDTKRVNFYINGKLVQSITTTLPLSSALLRAQVSFCTQDATARNMRIINIETNS